ncbi:MAG: CCA tRNA nucleotidyltransferase [Hyphomicrobiales bacterium]
MSAATREALAALLRDRSVEELLDALDGGGEETRIVGGAVRNALMGLPVTEIDLATTALPQEVTRRAERAGFKSVPTGIEHGTVTVVVHGRPFEVTTLREDIETDGRHAVVRFGRSFAADAARRDFTINALSLDRGGKVHDEVGGLADIAARRVRFIGEPQARIVEDYLRILRFFRFHASYATGPLDAEGFAAAIKLGEGLRGLSAERLRNELLKLLVAPGAVDTAWQMLAGGFWPLLLGGVPHIGRFASFAMAHGADIEIGGAPQRLAALAILTREDAARLRETLRLSNAQAAMLAKIANALERMHGFMRRTDAAAFDTDFTRLVLDLGAASVTAALAIEAGEAGAECVAALRRRAGEIPRFPLSGAQLLKRGVKAGPEVGRILARAREAWIEASCPLDGPSLATILEQAMRQARH